MTSTTFTPLLAFMAVVVMIPVALWLLRRSGYAGAGQDGLLRTVSTLALSPSQKVVVVEVGQGATARWLVLGVTPDRINPLTQMDAPAGVPAALASPQAATVSQLIAKWRTGKDAGNGGPGHE
jgi:flagellar protein FliO/FliZ